MVRPSPSTATLFRPVKDRRVFEEVLAQLEEAIADGRIAAGDRLPSERELAQQFGVARTSVREALRVLEALGVIRVSPGSERGATMIAGSGDAFREVLRFQLVLQHISIPNLVEFRIVIESWSASAAAARAAAGDFGLLDELVAAMHDETLRAADFLVLDARFHLEIARLARNEMLVLVLEGARNAIQRAMREAISTTGDSWAAVRARLAREHGEILRAIRAGDGPGAAQLVAAHIEKFYAETGFRAAPPTAT